MSGSSDDPDRKAKDQKYIDDEVGYGRPPIKTRWVRGQSGNPKGSSKTRRRTKENANMSVSDSVLAEGNRLVKIKEGDQILEITMDQALLRGLHVLGLKGSRIATKDSLDLIYRARKEIEQQRQERYLKCIEYVDTVRPEFEQNAKLGKPPPNIVPHPDDIEFNHRTGVVYFQGPLTRDEKRKLEKCEELRDELNEVLRDWREATLITPPTPSDLVHREKLKALVTDLNSVLPPRLRKMWDED